MALEAKTFQPTSKRPPNHLRLLLLGRQLPVRPRGALTGRMDAIAGKGTISWARGGCWMKSWYVLLKKTNQHSTFKKTGKMTKMRMMNKGRARYLNNSFDSPISAQEIPSPSLSLNISPTSSFVQKITPELPDLASHHAEMFSVCSWQAYNFITHFADHYGLSPS